MVNRLRISGILYLLSTVILMYCVWFKVTFTLELMALSWSLLAVSRALIMFPNIGRKAEVKIGKEIKT
jgi:hypothetical protein